MDACPKSGNNPELEIRKTLISKPCCINNHHTLTSELWALPVNKQIFCQPFGANDFKNDLISFKGLEVDAARQSRMQTLGEAFPNDEPLRQERVAEIALQSLKEIHKQNFNEMKTDGKKKKKKR